MLLYGVIAMVIAATIVAEPYAQRRASAQATALRVCADPNNLPFSNGRQEGFENLLARIVAKDLGRPVRYTWWPQRRGFTRNTLGAGACDVIMGVPASYELALTTRPYYRSTYVFVTRQDRRLDVRSLDDERLRRLTIGLHVIGDDYASVPPAQALARRGIVSNIRGYSIYGDYLQPNPPAALIDAVASGQVDVAIAWGPLAGYFAARQPVPMRIEPVSSAAGDPALQLTYEVSMGVRRGDTALRDALDRIIEQRRRDIGALLDRFHVPAAVGTAGTR